ncbi:hypothetical protein HZF10_09225 [Flavobacterium sp. MAH-1]|uniref:Uncharacterized protein n=1 Tax=Flavobacterium agri TaxID=2743471 RepID=A0A7Y8Y1W6_9FLAO|nr:hypothetical protein [Flavobacterium agri]NYA71099.1 hypothetical protein [Flavobacterium agri]
MENQDKIFEQIKQAADNSESKEFPALESVWSRVEDKLDNKVLTKQNKKWKQWAVAASVVAVVSLGYQLFKAETETPAQNNGKTFVVKANKMPEIKRQSDVVSAPIDTSSVIKKDAGTILKRQLETQPIVARSEEQSLSTATEPVATPHRQAMEMSAPAMKSVVVADAKEEMHKAEKEDSDRDDNSEEMFKRSRTKGIMAKGRVFDAHIVTSDEDNQTETKKTKTQMPAGKQKPLLIVDGKPLVAKTQKEYDSKLNEMMESVPTERDTVFYLKEPLYIINGTEYSEDSLFGATPTSPYAPLNLQEEGMTTRIYTGKEALKRFGDKGKNGVIVITTKNGKPAAKQK